jgi:poly(3-hydroxyalkanoate) synthetase
MPEQTYRPEQAWRETLEFGARLAHSAEALGRIREEDVDVGATPKTEVMRIEKVTLSRYTPLEGVEVRTGPVLIVYGLVGRYTMADLQEDRSLVRNLLGAGSISMSSNGATRRERTSSSASKTISTGFSTIVSIASARRPVSTRSRCSASARAARSPPSMPRGTPRRCRTSS